MAVAGDKKVLIVIDDCDVSQRFARGILSIIGEYSAEGYTAWIIMADSLSGTDLLPAYAFFLGCEEPEPFSFNYIEDLLRHINLAGRSCGVFSSQKKALKYLSSLVQDSEAAAGEPYLIQEDEKKSVDLRKWIYGILKKGEKIEQH